MPKDDDLIDIEIRVTQETIQRLRENLDPEPVKKAAFDLKNAGRNAGAVAKAAKALKEANAALKREEDLIQWYEDLLDSLLEKKKSQPSGFDQGPGGGRPGMNEFMRGFGIGLGGGLPGGPGASDLLGGLGGGGGPVVDFSPGVTGGGGGAASSSSGGGSPSGEWRGINGEHLGSGSNPSLGRDASSPGSPGGGGAPSGGSHAGQGGEGAQHGGGGAGEAPSGRSASSSGSGSGGRAQRNPRSVQQPTGQGGGGGDDGGSETPNPDAQWVDITGNPITEDATRRLVRFQAGFVNAPLGPSRAFTPEGGTTDVGWDGQPIDWSMLDPVGPVSYVDGVGPSRASGARTNFQNPYIEALYPEGGTSGSDGEDDETVQMVDRFVGQPVTVPQDPTAPQSGGARGGTVVAYSAGVTSPTIEFDTAGRVRRVTR